MTPRPDVVRLDLNSPEFQRQLFALPKKEQTAVLKTLAKLSKIGWSDVYRDAGLRWEAILSRPGPGGGALYSMRIGRGFRAVAFRDGDWLRILTLHPDHVSTYR